MASFCYGSVSYTVYCIVSQHSDATAKCPQQRHLGYGNILSESYVKQWSRSFALDLVTDVNRYMYCFLDTRLQLNICGMKHNTTLRTILKIWHFPPSQHNHAIERAPLLLLLQFFPTLRCDGGMPPTASLGIW